MIIAWPPLPTAFLLFVAIAPLLLIREQLRDSARKHLKFWGWSYLCLFLFNTGTTWWVWNASPEGCLMMLVGNSLLMSIPFLVFSFARSRMKRIAYVVFTLFYIAFEYFHFSWSAAWPWLTLGKGFASMPYYIQWYEYTGELGGSLLILAINCMVARLIIKEQYKRLWQPLAIVAAFGLLSVLIMFIQELPKYPKVECVISQPNIDPYTEKFSVNEPNYLYPEIQLDYALEVCEPLITPRTKILLMPETAIVGWNNERELNTSVLFEPARRMTDNTGLCIITGAETFTSYGEQKNKRPTMTARKDEATGLWYDVFNTSMIIDSNVVKQVYHKSKLVPGVEKMPFDFLEQLSIKLGGSSGSLGVSEKAINFRLSNGIKVAPLICYESVFGDYTNEFVADGANILAVVTNDGWWRETPGYRQHLLYGAIRCIETRRDMIRSANTGVSAYIDRFGNIKKTLKYKLRGALKCEAQPYMRKTFYVQHGNIIGKLCSVIGCMLVLSLIVKGFIKRS